MEKEELEKRIQQLEIERDEMEDRGYSFSVYQIEEEIEKCKSLLSTITQDNK